ncbi:MAG TPA: energy transducer TonB [Longimicrobiaceae bacterium]|nr:energy transducer TonB [Longimicrobiaceae bacterium]
MFNVLVSGGRKRRLWNPLTVAVSLAAHLVLLDLAMGVADGDAKESEEDPPIIWIDDEPSPPPPPPAPPVLARAYEPPASTGETLEIQQPPQNPPPAILPPRVTDVPVNPAEYSGQGPIGQRIGPPSTNPPGPTGGNGTGGSAPYTSDMVHELPRIANEREAQNVLRRSYPTLLRNAGVEGRVMLQAVIDENGVVVPGSVTVVSATHESFAEAALRAIERFRFRPAKVDGRSVAVMISIPVDWTLEH